jgi:tripartite-type tricarboxylate transporter receptor subunit TctC
MKSRIVHLVAALALASLVSVACSAPAAAPAPTQPPASAPKAADATKAPAAATAAPAAAQPTSAPAKAVDFPIKGKPITLIVGAAAGGGNDIGARILAPGLEKELGVPVQVMNKEGAVQQVGINEMIKSKPDGHTLAYLSIPSCFTSYLDPNRKATATFSHKDIQQVANDVIDPEAIMVRADSPFKTLKDFVDAAKANPNGLKLGTAGFMGNTHLELLLFQKVAGVKFTFVHFESGAPSVTALLGGHVDAIDGTVGAVSASYKSGQVRYLAVADKVRSPSFPSVPTMEEEGYKVYYGSSRGISAPAGTPKEVVDILAKAIKKVADTPEVKQKEADLGLTQMYMGPEEYTKYWTDFEDMTKPLLEEAAAEAKK